MPEHEPKPPPGRSSLTGPMAPSPARSAQDGVDVAGDLPTVRTGSATGSGDRVTRTAEPAAPLPRPGDRLDAFLLEESIGVGGMGAVYRAHDGQLDREVALKILPPEQARDAESVGRFCQEARAAARLDHENIARVYSIGHSPPYHYIVFEFIEGRTLRQLVDAGGVLSVADAINTTLQIATALVHASDRGVVHRDVKPSNIIVTPQGRAKLVDMGLARSFERGGDAGLTQTGMTLGTFDYISPEQARDPRAVDVRSDLYSLGCTVFFMLAGRPPFPDGTVLQKLLQHQEEPAPDLRAANPAVPGELSAIVLKLMAKDRDRRYQSPEGLVRDLLVLAGALNLRSIGTEGLVYREAAPVPASWESHLVWGIPALAFGLILAYLGWSNGLGDPVPPGGLPISIASVAPPKPPKPTVTSPPAEVVTRTTKSETTPRPPTRDVFVKKSDDLARLIAESPAGTTLLLADDGPYDLRPGPNPIAPRDLTIRAGIGVQPVLRLAPGSRDASAILNLKGGRIAIDGIEFQVDAEDRDDPIAAVRAEDADVSIARCVFRRVGTKPDRGRTSCLIVRATSGDSTAGSGEIRVDACHFEGGQSAIRVDGPVDLTVRDATIAGARLAAIHGTNADASGRPASIRLLHVSLILGSGPALRSVGVPPRVRLIDSVVAPAGEASGVLVVADDPTRLDWQGRDNLYASIGTFLEAPRGAAAAFMPIRLFDAWADDPSNLREAGSTLSNSRVWAEADPMLTLSRDATSPSAAFRLAAVRRPTLGVGARRGPFGVIATETLLASAGSATKVAEPPNVAPAPPIPVPTPADPKSAGDDPPLPMKRMDDPDDDLPPEMPVVVPPADPSSPMPKSVDPDATSKPRPPVVSDPAPVVIGPAREAVNGRIVRTPAQLATILEQVDGRGETLRLPADADWEMPACRLEGTGSWVIQAEPGKTRPRIRFRPKAGDSRVSDAWTAWLTIASGSLRVEGIDLVLSEADAPGSGGWAAFAMAAGADLTVQNGTVTVEGSARPSAVVLAATAREPGGVGDPVGEPLTATVLLKDSLFRTGGDLVDVAADRRLDLQVENAVVATSGSLLRGHGRARGVPAEPIKVTLRRLAARSEGGLIRLEGGVDTPELPVAEVVARETRLSPPTAEASPSSESMVRMMPTRCATGSAGTATELPTIRSLTIVATR